MQISDLFLVSLLDYMLAHAAPLVLLNKHISKELNKMDIFKSAQLDLVEDATFRKMKASKQ